MFYLPVNVFSLLKFCCCSSKPIKTIGGSFIEMRDLSIWNFCCSRQILINFILRGVILRIFVKISMWSKWSLFWIAEGIDDFSTKRLIQFTQNKLCPHFLLSTARSFWHLQQWQKKIGQLESQNKLIFSSWCKTIAKRQNLNVFYNMSD